MSKGLESIRGLRGHTTGYAVGIDVLTNALILPVLARLPKDLRESKDGEVIAAPAVSEMLVV